MINTIAITSATDAATHLARKMASNCLDVTFYSDVVQVGGLAVWEAPEQKA